MLAIAVLTVTGLVVGWSIDASVAEAIGGFALLILVATAMIWLGTLVGVMARTPDAVKGFAFMTVFPLPFLSNAFVPAEGLPDGLQHVAEWNPVSAVVAAVLWWSCIVLRLRGLDCTKVLQTSTFVKFEARERAGLHEIPGLEEQRAIRRPANASPFTLFPARPPTVRSPHPAGS